MRYRAVIEYDGTDFQGSQRQRRGATIQQALEVALDRIDARVSNVALAGRTDAGVHALGQVIAFDSRWKHGSGALLKAINANLPPSIRIRELAEAGEEFHPRFDATARKYEYHIYNHEISSPLRRRFSWHVRQPLDAVAMNLAAVALEGEHDFATFGRPTQGEVTVRTVFSAGWRRNDRCLVFSIEANAFLRRMVRSLVGTMKELGEGRWSVEDFIAALDARDRKRSGITAPPHGLHLVSVSYVERVRGE